MMECNTNRDNFLNNSWTIFNKAPPPHSSRIIVNPLSGEWRTPDIEPISTTKKSALNQRAALSVHVPLRGGGRANTGTMRIVHDLSSFTQQPSIKPFLLEITCPVNWIIPSLLYTPHIPPLSSRSMHVWSKIRFRDTFDRHELVKGQSNFYDSFPFHEGVGAETRANFLKEEVVSRGREAGDGRAERPLMSEARRGKGKGGRIRRRWKWIEWMDLKCSRVAGSEQLWEWLHPPLLRSFRDIRGNPAELTTTRPLPRFDRFCIDHPRLGIICLGIILKNCSDQLCESEDFFP